MRCTQLTHAYVDAIQREVFKAFDQTNPEVAQDETAEQVFSRKTDRKAYRQAVLKQRTAEAKRKPQVGGDKERKTRPLGKEVKARSKTRSR